LAVSSRQNLEVYDILSNEVVKLVDEYKSAGVYEINFDPASGIGYAFGEYTLISHQ